MPHNWYKMSLKSSPSTGAVNQKNLISECEWEWAKGFPLGLLVHYQIAHFSFSWSSQSATDLNTDFPNGGVGNVWRSKKICLFYRFLNLKWWCFNAHLRAFRYHWPRYCPISWHRSETLCLLKLVYSDAAPSQQQRWKFFHFQVLLDEKVQWIQSGPLQ